jgi:hypothetical protein
MTETTFEERQGEGLVRLIKALPADDTIYLNHLETIGSILRDFAGELAGRKLAVNRGEMTTERATELTRSDTLMLGEAFLGKSDIFVVTDWNTPEQLGEFLRKALNIADGPEVAPAAMFAKFASEMLDIIETAYSTLDEQWQPQADGLIEYYGNLLIGLELTDEPPSAAAEG